MGTGICLADMGMVNALGCGKEIVWQKLMQGSTPKENLIFDSYGVSPWYKADLTDKKRSAVEQYKKYPYAGEAVRYLEICLDEISPTLDKIRETCSSERVGVVIGITDNGSRQALGAVGDKQKNGSFPQDYKLDYHLPNYPAECLLSMSGFTGPVMTVSTACSSSALAMQNGKELIEGGLCDAVIVGGTDIVTETVHKGFSALEAVSPQLCNPFSQNRKGITLGEGAALFVMAKKSFCQSHDLSTVSLLGVGETSDAHHMTAPDPSGDGAARAMEAALQDAKLKPEDIDYLNLHGTGTMLNDGMESRAVDRVFPKGVPCSSTKPFTGHTLGAAGATEAAFCWMLLNENSRQSESTLPVHIWDGENDINVPSLQFIKPGETSEDICYVMSNSFAFGGNNLSVILGKDQG